MIRRHPSLQYPPLVTMYAQMALTLRKRSDNFQRRGVHFQRHQDRANEDGPTSSPDEAPERTTAPERQQDQEVRVLKGPAQHTHDSIRKGTWVTAHDIRTLAASIDQGHQRIISAIQSNPHGRGGGVDPHNGAADVGGPSRRRARPAGSTGVKIRSPFENRLSVRPFYHRVPSFTH